MNCVYVYVFVLSVLYCSLDCGGGRTVVCVVLFFFVTILSFNLCFGVLDFFLLQNTDFISFLKC